MKQEERQRMRNDMRDAYRDAPGPASSRSPRQMSPEERGQLRRDIEDANRGEMTGARTRACVLRSEFRPAPGRSRWRGPGGA